MLFAIKYCISKEHDMQINVLECLQRSAELYKDKTAFADEHRELSFSELYELAGKIGKLIDRSLNNGTTDTAGKITRRPFIVPVERSCMNIAAMMGVLMSGNFYVPLDSGIPKPRIDEITRQLDPAGVMLSGSDGAWRDNFKSCGVVIDILDAENFAVTTEQVQEMQNRVIDTDPAYVMYTSGSTGAPKGIVIPHRAVLDLSQWLVDVFGFTADDVFAEQTPFFFDASVKEIYAGIRSGATVRILPKSVFAYPLKVVEFLNTYKVTTTLWATSAASMLCSSGVFEHAVPQYLNKVSFAGETLYAKHLNQWRRYIPDAMYVNLYGPTEATVDAAYYIVNRDFDESEVIPIGNACRNMEVFLLNEDGSVIPQSKTGETGEICIRGTAVAYGYFGDPDKTDAVFTQDPRNNNWREYIYRTGDLARYNEYSEIVFVSRFDGQIKHMGARVELGDIEAAALSLAGVTAAVCVHDPARERIALFYTGTNENVLRELREALPPYMCPRAAIHLDAMPLTKNGKADRVSLNQDYRDGKFDGKSKQK